ncbi:MAG: flagellar protein FlaG [Plesiomonas sp.]|uniref:flagellar protein FlaG n=1 Tax=Plesiomonas sp. TaxID=2486279 RepID=UPI003F34DCC3
MSVSGLSITPCTFTASPLSAQQPVTVVSGSQSPTAQPHHTVSADITFDNLQQPTQHSSIVCDEVLTELGAHSADSSPAADDAAELSAVTQQLNEFMRGMNRQLSFHLDEDLNRQVVSVVDRESGEVIRQLPSKEMLELAKKMADQMAGILLNTEV